MVGRRWTTPRGPENRFPLNKENVNKFLWYSGACYCRHNTRQSYNHCHILHNFSLPKGLPHFQSTARTWGRSWIQLHHDNAAPHKARIIQTYLDHMTIVSVWWNFHHTRPSWLRSISGSFQKSNQLLLGSLFQGSKTLVKLCIQRWGPYLLQSTGNLSEVKDAVPDTELAPFDFWLFPKIKSAFAGKPFSRIQDLGKAVHSEMRAIPASEYRQSFRSEGYSAGSLRPWDKGDWGGGARSSRTLDIGGPSL